MDDPKNFYNWVQITMLGVNLACFGMVVLIILIAQINGKLSEILVELRRHPIMPMSTPPAPPPAPGPTAAEIEAMVQARALELVKQIEATRKAATPPPVNSSPPRPTAPRPTPPKPTT